jgi:AraC-like DNA-binding protein
MPPAARIRWEDAYDAVIPQINADGLLVQQFDSTLPVQVRFYGYDPHRDYRICRHDYFEIFYLYGGEAVFHLGERAYPMRQGDLIILNSTHYHTIRPAVAESRHAIQGVLLYFMPEAVRAAGLAGEDTEYLTPFLRQDERFPHVVNAATGVPAQVYELMRMIAAELPARGARARLSVRTYLKMALIRLVNHFAAYQGSEESFHHKHRLIERLDPLFRHLDSHYNEPITLEDAARLVGMSKSHFIHFMKQVTGLSFVSYLNQFRVNKAQALLASTGMSIAAISQEVGFCDQSYFGHVFRKLLGVTPRDFRLRLELDGRKLPPPSAPPLFHEKQ